MEKRITLVTMFDNEEINKIETLMLKTNKKLAKYHMELMMKRDMK